MVDAQLWETNPEKAAKLAFLELQMLWETQVDEGQYLGIPNPTQTTTRRIAHPLPLIPKQDFTAFQRQFQTPFNVCAVEKLNRQWSSSAASFITRACP